MWHIHILFYNETRVVINRKMVLLNHGLSRTRVDVVDRILIMRDPQLQEPKAFQPWELALAAIGTHGQDVLVLVQYLMLTGRRDGILMVILDEVNGLLELEQREADMLGRLIIHRDNMHHLHLRREALDGALDRKQYRPVQASPEPVVLQRVRGILNIQSDGGLLAGTYDITLE